MPSEYLAGEHLAGEYLVDDIAVLPRHDDLGELSRRLRSSGHTTGVVVGVDGEPEFVLGPNGPAPALTVGPTTPLQLILDDSGVLAQLNADAPGVVVVEQGKVLGLVPTATLLTYLLGESPTRTQVLGDQVLGGNPIQPRIQVVCAFKAVDGGPRCDTRNVLSEFDPGVTMCQRGHVLTVPWA